jgi:hypothetical protein
MSGASSERVHREGYSSCGEKRFNPLTEPGLYFSPELTAAIEADSSRGEVEMPEADPG